MPSVPAVLHFFGGLRIEGPMTTESFTKQLSPPSPCASPGNLPALDLSCLFCSGSGPGPPRKSHPKLSHMRWDTHPHPRTHTHTQQYAPATDGGGRERWHDWLQCSDMAFSTTHREPFVLRTSSDRGCGVLVFSLIMTGD